jgi:hypothetical protein
MCKKNYRRNGRRCGREIIKYHMKLSGDDSSAKVEDQRRFNLHVIDGVLETFLFWTAVPILVTFALVASLGLTHILDIPKHADPSTGV